MATDNHEGWTKKDQPQEPEPAPSSPSREEWAIAQIEKLRHRVAGSRSSCRCKECRALVQVLTLAREAVAMKNARRNWRKAERANADIVGGAR